MRRQFRLPETDERFLDVLGHQWETINDGGVRWLMIHDRHLPAGYTISSVTEALRIDPGYPDTQIDMVYFSPHLKCSNGKTIAALNSQQLEGKDWQRWSRHRQPEYPWRPGEDDISTHLLLVDHWLEREVQLG